jgi:hypothetical protein
MLRKNSKFSDHFLKDDNGPHMKVKNSCYLWKQELCHTLALAFYIEMDLKAKEELWKLKYFTIAEI